MRYALGYAWKLPELYENFKTDKLIADIYSLKQVYSANSKRDFCCKVLRSCLKIIVDDIIENDVEFQLPTGSRKTSIRMRTYRDVDFQTARQHGKFMDVDFLNSNFTANQLQLYMYGHRNIPKIRPIYVNKDIKDRITQYSNQARIYYGKIQKTINDYLPLVQQLYPIIPISDLTKILNFGFKSLYLVCSYGGDVSIRVQNFWFYIGYLYRDSLAFFKYYKVKLCNKMRVLSTRHKVPWDGYYYFALNDTQHEAYQKATHSFGRPRKHYILKNIKFYKLKEECLVANSSFKHFYRMPYPMVNGYSFFKEKLDAALGVEHILDREPLKLKDILTTNYNYELI